MNLSNNVTYSTTFHKIKKNLLTLQINFSRMLHTNIKLGYIFMLHNKDFESCFLISYLHILVDSVG